jgi:hypothetical protein
VAVADLDKTEVSAFAGFFVATLGEGSRHRNAAAHCPDESSACPCHALQKPTTVDAIVVKVLYPLIDEISVLIRHLPSVVCRVLSDTWRAPRFFAVKIEGDGQKILQLLTGRCPNLKKV